MMLGSEYYYLLVVVLTSFYVSLRAKTCEDPLLKDKGPKRDFLIRNSGAPNENLTLETPKIGGTDAWELRYGGNQTNFTSPFFALHDNFAKNHFWITSIAIQNGFEPGSTCGSQMTSQNNFIQKLKITVGPDLNMSKLVSIHAPYAAQRDDKGEPVINLQQLGFKGRGKVIRLNFPPIAADVVNLNVIEFSQAPDPNKTQSVCLRVEIYGCMIGPANQDPPDINSGPLLQYIMPYPDALVDGYMHLDTAYTGLDSLGLLSGGAGILTDGSLGITPAENPELYLGWSICATSSPYVIFLFDDEYPIADFIARLWDNQNNRIVEYHDFKVYDKFDNEIAFDGFTVFNISYLKITFSYPANSMVLLLSEVSFANESKFDVLTGANLTGLLLAKYQDISEYTTTTFPSVTSNFTSSSTSSPFKGSSNITNPTEPTVITVESVQLEQTTILYIIIGILALFVVLLGLLVLILGLILLSCYRSNRQSRESQFYPERLDDSDSGKNSGNSNPMESIRSNEARVTADKPLDLSESQVYL